jgi:DNA-directed RNA polymerase specialized sigma24 family protein
VIIIAFGTKQHSLGLCRANQVWCCAQAKDITQQVILGAWHKLDGYQPGPLPFLSWLYRIARKAVMDHYRTHKPNLPLGASRPHGVSQVGSLSPAS